jgi:3-methyladenine DNA glycosylase AlkD
MIDYINSLEIEFKKKRNPIIASEQKAYMRNQFEFYGIKSSLRREIQKPFLAKKHLPKFEELNSVVKLLWEKPQREYQLFAQELVHVYLNELKKHNIELFEYMITNNSWWDTVDYIAPKLTGHYFKTFPNERNTHINKWINSNNIWLQRSALLFQLKYKEELDNQLLILIINKLIGSNEFFINKAIGWVLREYSRTNPKWVINFTSKTKLSSLSNREALRLLK